MSTRDFSGRNEILRIEQKSKIFRVLTGSSIQYLFCKKLSDREPDIAKEQWFAVQFVHDKPAPASNYPVGIVRKPREQRQMPNAAILDGDKVFRVLGASSHNRLALVSLRFATLAYSQA